MVGMLPNSVKSLIAFDTWKADPARTLGNAGFHALSLISGNLGSGATRAGVDLAWVSTPLERRPTTDEVATRFLARFPGSSAAGGNATQQTGTGGEGGPQRQA